MIQKSSGAEMRMGRLKSRARFPLNPESRILNPYDGCNGVADGGYWNWIYLSAAELVAFEALLDLPDNTLWDMMSGRQNNDDPAQSALLEKIKSV
jgi:hypothetical protein